MLIENNGKIQLSTRSGGDVFFLVKDILRLWGVNTSFYVDVRTLINDHPSPLPLPAAYSLCVYKEDWYKLKELHDSYNTPSKVESVKVENVFFGMEIE